MSKYTHSAHRLVDKVFYSVVKQTVISFYCNLLTHLFLGTAAMTGTGDDTDQHHELAEVHLVVAVEIQSFHQLVYFFRVFGCLHDQEKWTLVSVFQQHKVQCLS